jgi:hypothetical protein
MPNGRDARMRQLVGPMEGEVRLPRQNSGAYAPIVLVTIFPLMYLPSTASAITETLWPRWKAAAISSSRSSILVAPTTT